MIREYKTIQEISGPLMVVDRVRGVTYDELGEIELSDGTVRRCQVLEVNGDTAVVQLFENSAGINLAESKIRFLGHPLQLGVSGDMLGRVFNGMGEPIDGGPAILADEYRDINGLAMSCPFSPAPACPTPPWPPRSPGRPRCWTGRHLPIVKMPPSAPLKAERGRPTSPWSLPPSASPLRSPSSSSRSSAAPAPSTAP